MNDECFIADMGEIRLDAFLAQKLQHTRSHIKNLIQREAVVVDGRLITKAGYMLKGGESVAVNMPPVAEYTIKAENIPIKIVFEDDELAVVDKPQNMSVHPSGRIVSGTLVNALLFALNSLSQINGEARPGIVHRLDKDTSGLLLIAKNDRSHAHLAAQIANKTARRTYTALCEGVFKQQKGIVKTRIGRHPTNRKMMAVLSAGAREAITEYEVLERFENHTLVSFNLQTGRTHQIRVHAKHLNHPIVGDKTYGFVKQKFDLVGQLLHSTILEFKHPTSTEIMRFTSPLPQYFENVLKKIRN